MSTESKITKLLAGICLNYGTSLQTIVRQFGIKASTPELEQMIDELHDRGYVHSIEKGPKGIFAQMTSLGNEKAKDLLEYATA
ncbi:hypothetical protein [Flammeovirga sp. OC4]|uniref:hypothetical protein n=1 Tax=Flammeovirga sp. OC4 TaxID=1382345 RepID=UPI0005C530AA|nr:hypothetical protein [Flammeovirga sp. OC4]